jgi:Ca2+/Na+ antiporter
MGNWRIFVTQKVIIVVCNAYVCTCVPPSPPSASNAFIFIQTQPDRFFIVILILLFIVNFDFFLLVWASFYFIIYCYCYYWYLFDVYRQTIAIDEQLNLSNCAKGFSIPLPSPTEDGWLGKNQKKYKFHYHIDRYVSPLSKCGTWSEWDPVWCVPTSHFVRTLLEILLVIFFFQSIFIYNFQLFLAAKRIPFCVCLCVCMGN